jgi:ABC-2 type transport system ATP-binding protein
MNIEVRDLAVRYGRRTALAGVTLDVVAGAVCAVVGRNGSGKSTLVRALLGQRRADAGTIRVGGLDPWRERTRLMARVGATPESPDAPASATAATLARWARPFHDRWDDALFAARLARFEVDPATPFGELSRGQRGLVMLALALAPRPGLLLLDDPTLGLDPLARRFFFGELIGELAEGGVTVLMTSHDLDGVERIATDVAILHAGRVALAGPRDELRSRAGGGALEELFARVTGEASR